MTALKVHKLFYIFIILLFTNCDKDEDKSGQNKPQNVFGSSAVVGEQGTDLDINRSGQEETCIGDVLVGWEYSNLLNANHFEQVRIGCDGNRMMLRFSLPDTMTFSEVAEGTHNLYSTDLTLQNTQDLDGLYVQLFQNVGDPEIDGFASGTVEIQRNVQILGAAFSLVGYVDAEFYNQGAIVLMKGYFWKKETVWR